jgi:L-ribulose-5-phosphate 3-epimerase
LWDFGDWEKLLKGSIIAKRVDPTMVLIGAVESIIPINSFREIFEKGADASLDCIELRYRGDLPLAQLKELSTSYLPINSLMMGILWEHNIASPNEAIRTKGIGALRDGIKMANILGFRDILLVPGVGIPDVPYLRLIETSKKSIGEVVKEAEDNGIFLCVENVGNNLLYSPVEFANFVKGFNSENVRAYFDFANTYYCGLHPEWFIDSLEGLIRVVHVKNWDTRKKDFIPLTEKGIDFESIFKKLLASGYKGPFIMEIGGDRTRMVEYARENVVFLRKQLESAGY